jgi:hypothetical protein
MVSLVNNNVANLSPELIDYIWDRYLPRRHEADQHYHNAARVINYHARKYIINFVKILKPQVELVFESCIGIGDDNVSYLVHNKRRDNKNIFNTLVACQCCERHQVNKPKKLEPWVETSFNITQTTRCQCICRHYARWICRD